MVSTMFTRRYGVYIMVAILFMLAITHYREGIVSTVRFHYTAASSDGPPPADGRFHWENVSVDYPVQSLTSLPAGKPLRLPRAQFQFPAETASQASKRKERQAAVKMAFRRCWQSYSELAWMRDELEPLSGGHKDTFGGWAATLVDSLDTLWIMDMKDEFKKAAAAAVNIDLAISTMETVNVFETNIRHLGGFLAAYDLSGDKQLLAKAKEFGEMLLKAFDTPNRMPITRWRPQQALSGKQEADTTVLVAEIGSLSMEFTRLSQITGDMRYYDAIDRIMRIFAQQQEDTHLPGMWPISVDARRADFTRDTSFTLGAMSDSTYEYLPKMHALLGGTVPMYASMYKRSMDTAIKYNIFTPMTPDRADILMAGLVHRDTISEPPRLRPEGQHLVCFAGGLLALGGKLVGNEGYVKMGQKLTDGCIWAYRNSPMGIMPEVFTVVPCLGREEVCAWDEARYKEEVLKMSDGTGGDAEQLIRAQRLPPGFSSIGDRRYILRPEAIESVFILYRLTGEEYLLDAAWDMFQAIIIHTETKLANAALADVTFSPDELERMGKSVQMDSMESFWMAETLKYFYLIFSEPDLISLDSWVFNTEAHPFKRLV